jgi:hypothetical protein
MVTMSREIVDGLHVNSRVEIRLGMALRSSLNHRFWLSGLKLKVIEEIS